jgi:peptidoglycan hydrolase CwlO-like protein
MKEVENILDDIRLVMQETLSDSVASHKRIDAMVDKIRDKIETDINASLDRVEQLEGEIDSFEDGIAEVEEERDQLQKEAKEQVEAEEALFLVSMYRRAGGYCHDVTYGEKPLF